MRTILRYKFTGLILLTLIILYFILRLPNLTAQPIFADEAIYIRWAQVMRAEPTLRFISLQDGKTPLFMWLMIPLFKIFKDPLLAGRILSVLAGAATLLGALVLGWKYFNVRVGLWSAFLIVITPYIVFFDRMALVDSMLSAFSIWSLFFSMWLVQTSRLDLSFILGYVLGGGWLVKTPGLFNLMSVPIALISFKFTPKNKAKRFAKLLVMMAVSIMTALAIYNILRLGPGFDNLSSRNQDYIFSPTRLLVSPLDPFIPHFHDMADWYPKLLTVPILILILLGAALAVFKKNIFALTILGWALFPTLVEMALLKTFTARYLLFTIPPLLVLAGWSLFWLIETIQAKLKVMPKRAGVLFSLFMVVLLLPQSLNFDLLLLKDPARAPLPREERIGYFEEWTAGYGFVEIAKYLTDLAKKELIVVGTEGFFGTLPDGLWIYLDKTSNIVIRGDRSTPSASLRQEALKHPTFFVANKSRIQNNTSGLKLIKEYPKAKSLNGDQNAILFFQVEPPKKI